MKRICILGATGSIGQQACDLALEHPDQFKIVGASGHSRFETLEKKAIPHLLDTRDNFDLKHFLQQCRPDIVLNAISGFVGLEYSWQVAEQGIPLALANKETLVCGGKLFLSHAQKHKTPLYPVDSELSAVWQCLSSNPPKYIQKIYLTASGGPFLERENTKSVSKKEVLSHPTWNMGEKITIDSATLANKCLEFFEILHFLGAQKEQIQIIIHPQSIVHSLVQWKDNSMLAQLSPPDMKFCILFALNYPKRITNNLPSLDFKNLNLNFRMPDDKKFPMLQILEFYKNSDDWLPIVFNAANEVARNAFLEDRISFSDIAHIVQKTLQDTSPQEIHSLDEIQDLDARTREKTTSLLP